LTELQEGAIPRERNELSLRRNKSPFPLNIEQLSAHGVGVDGPHCMARSRLVPQRILLLLIVWQFRGWEAQVDQ
jgi:hypothetical protein